MSSLVALRSLAQKSLRTLCGFPVRVTGMRSGITALMVVFRFIIMVVGSLRLAMLESARAATSVSCGVLVMRWWQMCLVGRLRS